MLTPTMPARQEEAERRASAGDALLKHGVRGVAGVFGLADRPRKAGSRAADARGGWRRGQAGVQGDKAVRGRIPDVRIGRGRCEPPQLVPPCHQGQVGRLDGRDVAPARKVFGADHHGRPATVVDLAGDPVPAHADRVKAR